MVLPGIISNILPYGVFVEVAPGVTGLSPNNVSYEKKKKKIE